MKQTDGSKGKVKSLSFYALDDTAEVPVIAFGHDATRLADQLQVKKICCILKISAFVFLKCSYKLYRSTDATHLQTIW